MHLAIVNNPAMTGVSVKTSVVVEGPLQGYTGYIFSLNIKITLNLKLYPKLEIRHFHDSST